MSASVLSMSMSLDGYIAGLFFRPSGPAGQLMDEYPFRSHD